MNGVIDVRKRLGFLALLLSMTLLMSQAAYACDDYDKDDDDYRWWKNKWDNDDDDDDDDDNKNKYWNRSYNRYWNGPFNKLRKLDSKNITLWKKTLVKIRGKQFDSDMPPVIFANRTLMPVRAITEALGATVKWVSPMAYIVDERQGILVVFDLSTGYVYKITDDKKSGENLIEDVLDDDFDGLDEEDIEDYQMDIDVGPSLYGDRTYVPLRCLSEYLGYMVFFDRYTGQIDVEEGDRINPDSKTFEKLSDVEDVRVKVDVSDIDFDELSDDDGDLELGEDYTIRTYSDRDYMYVYIKEEYIEDLEEEENTVTFEFDGGIDEDFTLNLDYIDEVPLLTPDSKTFEEFSDVEDVRVKVDVSDHDFDELSDVDGDLDLGDDYTIRTYSDRDYMYVYIKGEYIESLDSGVNIITFEFDGGVDVEFELLLDYTNDEPMLDPDELVYTKSTDNSIFIEFDLNGFEFVDVEYNDSPDVDLEENVDYIQVNDDTVILLASYLQDLSKGDHELAFNFKDGSDREEVILPVEVK